MLQNCVMDRCAICIFMYCYSMHRVAAPTATLGRVEPSATHSAVPQPIGGVYSLGGSIESHLIPLPSLHDGEGVFFSRFGAIR